MRPGVVAAQTRTTSLPAPVRPEGPVTDTMSAPCNGVDTATPFATLDAVKADPEIGAFQFRATNTWLSGTHNARPPRLLRRQAGDGASAPVHVRRRPSRRARRQRRRADARGVPAARLGGLPHGGIANVAAARGVTSPRSPRPSRATSTSSASSGCRTTSATATSRSVSFVLRGDDPERLRLSSSSLVVAPRSSTCSRESAGVDRRRRRLSRFHDRKGAVCT